MMQQILVQVLTVDLSRILDGHDPIPNNSMLLLTIHFVSAHINKENFKHRDKSFCLIHINKTK